MLVRLSTSPWVALVTMGSQYTGVYRTRLATFGCAKPRKRRPCRPRRRGRGTLGLPCGVEKQGYPPGPRGRGRPPGASGSFARCHTHLSHLTISGLPRPPLQCMRFSSSFHMTSRACSRRFGDVARTPRPSNTQNDNNPAIGTVRPCAAGNFSGLPHTTRIEHENSL